MKRWLTFVVVSVAIETAAAETIRVQGAESLSRPLGGVIAENLALRYGDMSLEWGSLGSGSSFNALFERTAHFAITSRNVEPDEIELARRLGLELREAALALGGIAVVVHPENDVSRLSLEQLETLYSGRITRWLGVGGTDEPVYLMSTPEASDTRAVFRELVFGGEEAFASAVEYLSADEILDRVATERGAVGFVSMIDRSSVRTVPIVAGEAEDGVAPDFATIEDGRYPLRHGVWLYTVEEPKDALRDFLTFLFLHDGPRLIAQAGLVAVPGLTALVRSGRPGVQPVEVAVERISFGFRGSRLGRTARQTLSDVVERLAGTDEGLWIAGHAEPTEDGRGVELSLDRAKSVGSFLEEAGVATSRMVVKGRGTTQPLNPHDTLEGRRSNRRADIWILREP